MVRHLLEADLTLSSLKILSEDLSRYNEECHPQNSFSYWRHICKQAYTHPGLIAVVVFRYGGWVRACRIPIVKQIMEVIYQSAYCWVRFHLQIEIPRTTNIGPGFRIDHYGGILINSQSTIGRNVTVSKGVLLGGTESGAPTIGNDINCGVDVKIIGAIVLGDCMKIGAGAIVTRSFNGGQIIAGVPARVLRPLLRAPEPNGWIPPVEWKPEECA